MLDTVISIVSNIDLFIDHYIPASFYCCVFNTKVLVDDSLSPKLANDNNLLIIYSSFQD